MPSTPTLTPMEEGPRPGYLHDGFAATLRRRWPLVLVGYLAVLLLALLALGNRAADAKTYVGTASVLVRGNIGGDAADGGTSGGIDLDTETRLLTSIEVATRAQALLASSEDPSGLAGRVTATVPPDIRVLEVSFRADTPADAQRGAQAFATAYLDVRQATVTARVKAVGSRLAAQQKSLRQVAGQVAARPKNSLEYEQAIVRQELLTAQIASLTTMLSALLD